MGDWVAITKENDPTLAIDKHFSISCPHCNATSNITAVSLPRYQQIERYRTPKVIVGYRCDACNASIAMRFRVTFDFPNHRVSLSDTYEELERPMETFDYQYLPEAVASDFREALTCYSHLCLNATASMCRRTIQSVAENLGASGSDKVMRQIQDAKEVSGIDEDTFEIIKQLIVDGHDGAHPHLPEVTQARAAVIVELMKDVLHQIYIRKARVQAAVQLRKQAIDAAKS